MSFALGALLAGCSSSSTSTPQAPVVSLSATTLAFPNTIQNTASAPLTVTVANTGNAALAVSSIAASPAVFSIKTNTCGATLAAGAQCAVSVVFTPTGASVSAGALTITDNATGSPQSVALSGTGTITPSVTFNPTFLAFPATAVGTTSGPLTATITNNGNAALSLSSVGLTGANASSFTATNTCNGSIAALGSCSVSVTFAPTTALSASASFSIADSGVGSPQTLPLTGTAGVPTLTFAPTTLAFGTDLTGSTAQLSTTVTNTGSYPATISNVAVSGTGFALASNSCGSSLAAGAMCGVNVNFNPTTVGSFTGSVVFTDNATGSPQTISLTGGGAVEPNSCTAVKTTSPSQTAPTANYPGTGFSGKVMAGTTPIIGASVQIYAAGQTGNGSAPTALLTTPLITNSSGGFTVPASFTCPYNNSVLYAVARGGQAGSTGAVNAGTVLASVLGLCNGITGSPAFTINEVTTAATVWSMQQFLALGGKMGATASNSSGATNSAGIVLAAGTFGSLVNNLTGSAPGAYFPANGTAPTAKINQLANLLNACIVSTGAASTACTQLYTLTTTAAGTPTNTLDAALNLVRNPGMNVGSLYTLSGASTAYAPVLATAPADWTLFVTFSGGGMSDPSAISVDSAGRLWVPSYNQVASLFTNTGSPVFANGITGNSLFNSYGGSSDVNDVEWVVNEEGGPGGIGSLTLLNSSGASPAVYSGGGINFPLGIAFDTSGVTWLVEYGDSGASLFSNSGAYLSGTNGYTTYQYGFPVAVATDAKCNGWLANQATNTMTFTSASGTIFGSFVMGGGPSGVIVDATGNVWTANYYGSSVGLLTGTGTNFTVQSGATGFTGGGINRPQGIAADGAGNIWVANFRAPGVSELAGASATVPGAALSPSTGWATDAGLLEAFALAIDASGNIWITNFGSNTITELVGAAVPVKTPLLGPVRVP
jgi:hypothetical protein